MYNLILIGGFGRMGEAIREVLAKEFSENLCVAAIVTDNHQKAIHGSVKVTTDIISAAEAIEKPCIIDFSTPKASMQTAEYAAEKGIPLVIGTTGFTNEEMQQLTQYAKRTPLLHSSNMSVGITALRILIPVLVDALSSGFDIELVETHHNKKKDSPSGTALLLARDIATAKGWDFDAVVRYSRHSFDQARTKEEIGIQSLRGGSVFGVHTLAFLGEDEQIDITHYAYSRNIFARGALEAILWLCKQQSGKLYSMLDMLQK